MKNLLNTEILTRKEGFLVLLWEKLKEIKNSCKFRLDRDLFGYSFRNSSWSKFLPKKKKILKNTREAKAKRKERRGQKEAGGVRDELETGVGEGERGIQQDWPA